MPMDSIDSTITLISAPLPYFLGFESLDLTFID